MTLPQPNFLNDMVGLMEHNPNLSLAVCISNAINSKSEVIQDAHPVYIDYLEQLFTKGPGTQNCIKGPDFIRNFLSIRCLIPNVSGTLLNKWKYDKIGGVNRSFNRSGDYDLYSRILEIGDIVFLNKTLNSTRFHSGKLTTSSNRQSFKERYSILKRIFKKYSIDRNSKKNTFRFYFTVFKHDIFLKKSSISEILSTQIEFVRLYPLSFFWFISLLVERLKIKLGKI
jgi:hypothetical protein